MSILLFIVILSFLVFIHEFGHFSTARRMGIHVEEFGFGFPPRITGKMYKGVLYTLNWIPFGGFVRLKGEDGGHEREGDSFVHKSIPRRALVLGAGVLMNFFLAMLLFCVGFMVGIPSAITDDLPPSGHIREQKVQIVAIPEDSQATAYDLAPGDVLRSIEGQQIVQTADLTAYTAAHPDTDATLSIERDGTPRDVPVRITVKDGTPEIGIALLSTGIVSYPFFHAIQLGVEQTFQYTWVIISSFGTLVRDLVVHHTLSADVAGPLGVAALTGQVAVLGFNYVLQFVALLSLSLAIMNILPIPALDGGRMLFLIIEAVRGRAVSRRVEGWVHGIGFYVVLLLVVLISIRDFSRFNIGDAISSFFSNLF